MKIAIFTDTFLPQINGIVTATINLAKGLADKGHKIIIIAPKFKNFKEFSYHNIKVKRTASIPAFFYEGFKFTHSFSFNTFKLLRKEKVDLIHFQTPITVSLQGIILAKILDIPLIGTFHTFFADPQYLKHIKINHKFIQNISWAYARKYYNCCDLITCPSESTKEELIKHKFKAPIKTISNGIDSSIFTNINTKELRDKYNKNDKLLLFVGRIAHEKNIFYLLDCFRLVINKIPEARLLIIGDGPQMEELKFRIKKFNLIKNVFILGKIEHDILVKSAIYKACDLFVTASITENQPMTILEAQANGLVCVGINKRGIKDLIKTKYNGYATKYNKSEFVNSIIKLLTNNNLYKKMQKNTLKEIKNHEMGNVINIWEKEYQNLINKNKLIKNGN